MEGFCSVISITYLNRSNNGKDVKTRKGGKNVILETHKPHFRLCTI
jgi:hypothetical protein